MCCKYACLHTDSAIASRIGHEIEEEFSDSDLTCLHFNVRATSTTRPDMGCFPHDPLCFFQKCANTTEVMRQSNLTFFNFTKNVYLNHLPIIVEDATQSWSAMKGLNVETLFRVGHYALTVPSTIDSSSSTPRIRFSLSTISATLNRTSNN